MEDNFKTLFRVSHLIPISHGMGTDEMFKSMINSIISNNDFDYEEINNKDRFFVCKKISFHGNHIGYSEEEKRQSSFVLKKDSLKYQCSDFFLVEYKRPLKQIIFKS